MKRRLSLLLCISLLIQLMPIWGLPTLLAATTTEILEDNSNRLTYNGTWTETKKGSYFGGSSKFSSSVTAAVNFSFAGTGFRYVGSTESTNLPVNIIVDGVIISTIHPNSKSANKVTLYEKTDLPVGNHQVRIEVVPGSTTNSNKSVISLDRIQLFIPVEIIPVAPQNVQASLGSNGVNLSWSAAGADSRYQIYRTVSGSTQSVKLNASPLTGTAYTDSSLTNSLITSDVTATYRVSTVNELGAESSLSTAASVVIPRNNVTIPTGLTATVDAFNMVTLTWTSTSNANGYKVYRSSSKNGTFQLISDLSQNNSVSYIDKSLQNVTYNSKTNMYYKISAVGPFNESALSIDASVQMKSIEPLAIPQNLTAASIGSQVTLSWDFVTGASSYAIYRSNQSGASYVLNGTVGSTINQFISPLTVGTQTEDTTYNYTVAARYASGGESAYSNVVTATARSNTPDIPMSVTASVYNSIVSLQWEASLNATGYHVYRKLGDNGAYQQLNGATPLTATQYSDESLSTLFHESDTEYRYAISAVNMYQSESNKSIDTIAIIPSSLVVQLQSVCGENPNEIRLWKVINGSTNALTFVATLYGTNQINTYTVNGKSELIFMTFPVVGSNVLGISKDGTVLAVVESDISQCPSNVFDPTIVNLIPGNLLVNNEFEYISRSKGIADNWTSYSDNSSNTIFSVSPDESFNGSRSQLIEVNNLSLNQSAFVSQQVFVSPNKPFVLSGKFKAESLINSKVSIFVNFYNKSNVNVASWYADSSNASPDYVSLERVGKVHPEAYTARVYAIVKATGESASGKVFVDSMVFALKGTEIVNDGFEVANQSNGVADGWAKYVGAGAIDSSQVVNTPVFSETRAQKVSGSNIANGDSIMISQLLPVEEKKPFYMSGNFWIEGLQNSKVQLFANFYNTSNQYVGEARSEFYSTTSAYIPLERIGTVPVGATSVRIYAILKATAVGGSGTFYVDDIKFSTKQVPLINAGFEVYSGNNGTADGWSKSIAIGAVDGLQVVNTRVNGGVRAQKVSGSNIANGAANLISQLFPVEEGKPFHMSGMFFIESLQNSKVQLFANFYNASNQYVGEARSEFYSTTSDYIPLEKIGTVPIGATSVRVYAILRATGVGASGSFYVDDINFTTKLIPLMNSEFEVYSGSTGVADGWAKYVSTGAVDGLAVVNTPVYSGTHAQKVSGANIANGDSVMVSQILPVEAGKPFSIGGKFFIENLQNSKVQLFANFYNTSNQYVGEARREYYSTTTEYIPLEKTGVVPVDATSVRLYAILRSTGAEASGTFYVEDMSYKTIQQISLLNSGFEANSGTEGVADRWTKSVAVGSTDEVEVVNSSVVSGSHAQKVSGSMIPIGDAIMVSQLLPVLEGDLRQFSASIYVEQLIGSKVQVHINYYDLTDKNIGTEIAEFYSRTSGYIPMGKALNIPSGAVNARVYIIIRATGNNGSGTILVDDVSIN